MGAVIQPTDVEAACGDRSSLLCETVFDWTSSEWAARTVDWVIDRPLRILLIILVAAVVSRLVSRAITRFAEGLIPRHRRVDTADGASGDSADDPGEYSLIDRGVDRLRDLGDQQVRARQRALTLGAVLRGVARAAIWLIAGLLVLGEIDINLAPLLAGAGVAGVAIGFGAQSLVRDFLAGTFIIIEDQYGVGDIVDIGPAIGTVEAVTLRTTRLRDAGGVLWIVPNGEIRRVGNTSQLWSKSLLDIEVAYHTDVDAAIEVIKDVLDTLWRENRPEATIIEEPEVLGIEAFATDAIVLRAVVKTEPTEQFVVARVVRARLKQAFDDAGIEIPFPQRDVWVRTDHDAKA